MSVRTKSHTVKVTGVSDELLQRLDRRIRERHATGRAEYIRELIRKDVLDEKGATFAEILAPIHDYSRQQGYTEDELEILFDQARKERYFEKHPEAKETSSSL